MRYTGYHLSWNKDYERSRDREDAIRSGLFSIPSGQKRSYSQAINKACLQGNQVELRRLLDLASKSSNVQKKRIVFSRALRLALLTEHQDIVTMLIGYGADVNAHFKWHTNLCYAIEHGSEGMVKVLIKNGANPNIPCEERGRCRYRYPILRAVHREIASLVEFVISSGADVSPGGQLHGAFKFACQIGNDEIAKILLPDKTAFDTSSWELMSPGDDLLSMAASTGRIWLVKLLIGSGIIDAECCFKIYRAAIQRACRTGHQEILQLLLDSAARLQLGESLWCELELSKFERWMEAHDSKTRQYRTTIGDGSVEHFPTTQAAREGFLEIFQILLDRSPDPDPLLPQNQWKSDALREASGNGHTEVVKKLLAAGTIVDQAALYGNSMHLAVLKDKKAVVDLLVEHGADVDGQYGGKDNALCTAVRKDRVEILERLLQSTNNIDAVGYDGCSPLHVAAQMGNGNMVQMLIGRGASVSARNENKDSILHSAASQGHLEVVRLILKNGAVSDASNAERMAPLHLAAAKGYHEICHVLLDNGHDVNARNLANESALYLAAANGHIECSKILVDRGAEVNMPEIEGCGSTLYAAAHNGHGKIVDFLLHHGADIDSSCSWYHTALQTASFHGHEDIVKSLIEHGASPNLKGGHFGNALQAASSKGHVKIFQMLLSNGAEVNAEGGRYRTAIRAAVSCQQNEIVRLLLEQGATIDTADEDLENLLDLAILSGNSETVEILLMNRVPLESKQGWFGNPLEMALALGHDGIVEALTRRGLTLLPSDNLLHLV